MNNQINNYEFKGHFLHEIHVKGVFFCPIAHNLQKPKYGESSQILRKGLSSGSDRHVMNLFYQEKH